MSPLFKIALLICAFMALVSAAPAPPATPANSSSPVDRTSDSVPAHRYLPRCEPAKGECLYGLDTYCDDQGNVHSRHGRRKTLCTCEPFCSRVCPPPPNKRTTSQDVDMPDGDKVDSA
ncbi:hypothetical protein GE09DRAFT_1105862 [Coniochaeta sp. 2T2.1]|nr:hypothetical protein GE09DRAFT_1105862 [Coniochaeta sp. 2T2.1]